MTMEERIMSKEVRRAAANALGSFHRYGLLFDESDAYKWGFLRGLLVVADEKTTRQINHCEEMIEERNRDMFLE
jgi:hypothetical protein